MRTIKATDDLVIELWPAGTSGEEPVLTIKSLSGERDGVQQVVVVFWEEISHLIAALTEAAELLAAEAKEIRPDDEPAPPERSDK
jgi:hypothetical protein